MTARIVGGRIPSRYGGIIQIPSRFTMDAPGGLRATEYGAAFGPLEIAPYPESEITVGNLRFEEENESTGWIDDDEGLFAGAFFAGATWDRDSDVTRRTLLRAGAIGVLGGYATTRVVSGQETTTRSRGVFDTYENPQGIRIAIHDRADGYMPIDDKYYVTIDGNQYPGFDASKDAAFGDILPGMTGSTIVSSKKKSSWLPSVLRDRSKTYDGIKLEKDITTYAEGDIVVLVSNRIIGEAIEREGSDDTVVKLNGEPVPHRNENDDKDVGYYYIEEDQVKLKVGPDPPRGDTVTVTVYATFVQEAIDDAKRGVHS